MVQFKPLELLSADLPTEHDLPSTDGRPVDNELQLLIPILLRGVLELAWSDRDNWFLGANIGVYYEPKTPAVDPDAMLALGVPHYREGKDLRLSYVIWQERVMPQWVLEIVSDKPGKEYNEKMKLYAELGVLYYTIYNPKHSKRDKHDVFEMYRLVDGEYIHQQGMPFWMPELGLGLGIARGREYLLPARDWLYWYDEAGSQYLTKDSVIFQERQRSNRAELMSEAERQRAEAERQKAEAGRQRAEAERQKAEEVQQEMDELLQKLRDRNIDPETL